MRCDDETCRCHRSPDTGYKLVIVGKTVRAARDWCREHHFSMSHAEHELSIAAGCLRGSQKLLIGLLRDVYIDLSEWQLSENRVWAEEHILRAFPMERPSLYVERLRDSVARGVAVRKFSM